MYSPPMTRSDRIAEAARACLQCDCHGELVAVSCSCERGVLRLRGQVSSFHLKQLAQEAVKRTEGVVKVVNEVNVLPQTNLIPSNR